MKKLLLITLLALSAYADIKVDLLEEKQVNYPNSTMLPTMLRILCINGYQWLQFGGHNDSVSQMFEINYYGSNPIKCNNK